MVEEVEQEFIPMISHPKYEISTTQPWNFRRIGKERCLKQNLNSTGYLQVSLVKTFYVHRLVAEQFIHNDNPEIKIQVGHIDRNMLNNSLENLRWVSPSENCRNSTRHTFITQPQPNEYLNEMPENVHQIDSYKQFQFDSYYFDIDSDRILMITCTNRIKVLKPTPKCNIVIMKDNNGRKHKFEYSKLMNKLKELFD